MRIDARWAEGRNDRATEIATEFARANVDLIVTWATGPALATKQATVTIPIVFGDKAIWKTISSQIFPSPQQAMLPAGMQKSL